MIKKQGKFYFVRSNTNKDIWYFVRQLKKGWVCNCKDFIFRNEPCRHIWEANEEEDKLALDK